VLALAGMTVLLQYESVRWVLWLGGSAMLIWFAVRMLISAITSSNELAVAGEARQQSSIKEFGRGVFLAMSSPSAILWFAAVGGVLISRAGASGPLGTGLFLGGFFSAGVVWCLALCAIASQGGKLLGARLLKVSYLISAGIFVWFAVFVITSGYREFIIGAGA
jgi:L-lysine exporter family protein LysE/ArgO